MSASASLTRTSASAAAHASTSERVPSLDGWRALAITLVLVSHSVFAGHAPFTNLGPAALLFDGEFGVRIFFILSGFIITHLLAREAAARDSVSLRNFYVRRALRILPIYLAYLGLLFALTAVGRYHDASSSWLGCFTFTRNFLGRGDSATIHFWTLAIEEQFYLLWPLAFATGRLWRNRRLAALLLAAVLIACPLVRSFAPPTGGDFLSRLLGARSFFRYADALAIGCAAALIARPTANRLQLWIPLAAVAFLAQWILQSHRGPAPLIALAPLVQAAAIALLIRFSTVPATSWLHRALNHPTIVRVGVLSYSLYVWHMLFLSGFMGAAWTDFPTHHWTTWWIGAAVVATISYQFLEQPFLRLRHRFAATAAH